MEETPKQAANANEQIVDKKPFWREYMIPLSILGAGIMISVGLFLGLSRLQPQGTETTTTTTVDIKNVNVEGSPFIGNKDAKVTLAYWTDYQCPFCKKFELTTFEEIKKNYVDTGKIKIVFKDYAFLGEDSTTAALYGRAVWALYSDKFFEWRVALVNKQDDENGGFGDEASVKELTKSISGIDADKVAQYIADNKDKLTKAIDADKQEGVKFGVKGTPGFVTGKKLIAGAVSYENFSAALDAQLQ